MRQKTAVKIQWIPKVILGRGPKYLQIVSSLEEAIADGTLHPGDILPAQRQLAEQLNIDLTTVTRAYNEARDRFLIQTRSGKGTFITDPASRLTETIDLSMNIPPAPEGIILNQLIQDNMKMLLNFYDSHALNTYHNSGGNQITKQVASQWLKPILPDIDYNCIAVSPGAQSAISALILMLTEENQSVMVEPYTYQGIKMALNQLHRKPYVLDVDEEGPCIDSIARAIQQGINVMYLNPTIANPTTKTISLPRRQAIADLMNRHQIHLIEDDPYYLLAEQAPAPIAYFAPDYTYYISTVSKVIAPGFQIAYNVMPNVPAAIQFSQTLRSLCIMASPLMSALTTQLIRNGQALDILEGIKKESQQRLLIAKKVLHLPNTLPDNSIHIWYQLPHHLPLDQFMIMAKKHALGIVPSQDFTPEPHPVTAIRLSLGAVNSRSNLSIALHTIAKIVKKRP